MIRRKFLENIFTFPSESLAEDGEEEKSLFAAIGRLYNHLVTAVIEFNLITNLFRSTLLAALMPRKTTNHLSMEG